MFKDIIMYFISKLLPGLINVLTVYILTRLLTLSEYGEYSLVLTVVSVIYSFMFEWIRLSLLRFYKKFEERRGELLGTIAFINVLLLLILLAMGLIALILNNIVNVFELTPIKVLIIFGLVISIVLFNISKTIARAKLMPVLFGKINLYKSSLSLLLGILFYKMNLGINGLLIGIFIGTIISSLPVIKKEMKNLRVNSQIHKKVTLYGIPLIYTLFLAVGLFSIDRLMLAYYKGLEEVAIYTASYSLSQQSIFFLMTVVNLATFPLVINALEKNGEIAAEKELKRNFVFLSALSIPALLGVITLSDNIVSVLLDEEYRLVASLLFPLISIGVFFEGAKLYYFDLPFQLSGKTKLQRIPVLAAFIINISFNLLLIPKFGAVGGAITTIIAYISSMILSIVIGSKYFKLPFIISDLLKIVISSILMVLVLFQLNLGNNIIGLLIKVFIGATIYFILILLLNVSGFRKMVRSLAENGKD